MQENKSLEQARIIFSRGKMIHDSVNRIISEHMITCDSCEQLRDLSVTQLHAIMKIKHNGQLTMTKLADLMGVSPPSASAMVDRLVERGLLVREHSTEDRRKVVVRISPSAIENSQEVENTLQAFFVSLVEKIGSETAQQWCDVLAKVESVLEEE
jgi:DNA-binding MarR family transcriptional regulator